MAKKSDSMRISIRVARAAQDELAKELAQLGPYHRAKRLYLLASIGLAFERSRLAFPTMHLTPEVALPVTSFSVGEPASHSKEDEVGNEMHAMTNNEPYDVDLRDLWATGIMGD